MFLLKGLPLPCFQDKPPCDLQCVKENSKVEVKAKGKTQEILNFTGPVRVVIADPPKTSECTRSTAGVISLANTLIAANITIFIFYAFGFYLDKGMNHHAVASAVGLQFCLPLSILILHPLFGPAAPMDKSTRVWEHVKIVFLSAIFTGVGYYFAYKFPYAAQNSLMTVIGRMFPFNRIHWYGGIAVMTGFGISFLSGIVVSVLEYCKRFSCSASFAFSITGRIFLYSHRIFGMLTMVAGNVCYILGLITPSLQMFLFISGYFIPTITMLVLTCVFTIIMLVFPGFYFTEQNE